MSVVSMAWRNVGRNKRRTIVTIAAMVLGLVVMIAYSGLLEGYLRGLERNVLDLEVGDIQIHQGDYLKKPSLYKYIKDPDAIVAALEAKGLQASSRYLGYGLGATGETSSGVVIKGLDLADEKGVSTLPDFLDKGSWLEEGDDEGVVIGRKLAEILGSAPGDHLTVLTTGADGSIANAKYTIRGVLKSVSSQTDSSGVIMTKAAFEELMVFHAGAHRIIVRKPATMTLDQAKAIVVEAAPEQTVETWRELLPTIASMLDATSAAMGMMFAMLSIVIGILVLNAMLMAVFERIKEFGVLKAIGFGPGKVLRLIYAETLIQVGLAVILAIILALPLCYYVATTGLDMSAGEGGAMAGIAWDATWRGIYSVKSFTEPTTVLVAIVGLVILYPAAKAARVQPVEAMRHQ